jgi:hypothetical protein
MAVKPIKSRSELEAILMAEIRKHPECSNVEAVAITRPLGRPWDVAVVRDGANRKPECLRRVQEIAVALVAKYEFDGKD